MQELTKQQQAVLAHIKMYHHKHGQSPTRREIQVLMGFASPNAVTGHLGRLSDAGAIAITHHGKRNIRVIGDTVN